MVYKTKIYNKEEIMACPYLKGDTCTVYGTYQDDSQKRSYCLSSDRCTLCANFKPVTSSGAGACPYISGDRCSKTGTYQDGYHKQNYCLSTNNCSRCPNF